MTKGVIRFDFQLLFKDGRYKYVFENFQHDPYSNGRSFGYITTEEEPTAKFPMNTKKWKRLIWNDIKENIELNITALTETLKAAMSKKSDDNW